MEFLKKKESIYKRIYWVIFRTFSFYRFSNGRVFTRLLKPAFELFYGVFWGEIFDIERIARVSVACADIWD